MEYYVVWSRLDRADRYLSSVTRGKVWRLGILNAITWKDASEAEQVLKELEETDHEGRFYIRGADSMIEVYAVIVDGAKVLALFRNKSQAQAFASFQQDARKPYVIEWAVPAETFEFEE